MPLIGGMPVIAPFRGESNHQFTGSYDLFFVYCGAGFECIYKLDVVGLSNILDKKFGGGAPAEGPHG